MEYEVIRSGSASVSVSGDDGDGDSFCCKFNRLVVGCRTANITTDSDDSPLVRYTLVIIYEFVRGKREEEWGE